VFDGNPPALKKTEIKRRKKVKQDAVEKYRKAIVEGKREEAYRYAQATSHLKDYMEQDCKRLLTLMGIPWVQAPEEGEAQAAHITKKGDTDFCGSQDYDSILFGAPTLIRNITISGRRKLPRKPVYVEVVPEVVRLEQILEKLGITYEQLVDIGILTGTDYNPEGVKGVGPKTALKLIKEYGNIDEIPKEHIEFSPFQIDIQNIRNSFLYPVVNDCYTLRWSEPDIEGVIDFLCRERDFSEARVRRALEKMTQGLKEGKTRATLDSFFE
jgi:flap endonuclease-1